MTPEQAAAQRSLAEAAGELRERGPFGFTRLSATGREAAGRAFLREAQ